MAETTLTPPAADASPAPAAEPARARPSWLGSFTTRFAVIGVWILLVIVFGALRPDTFLTAGSFQTIFGGQTQQALVFMCAALLCTILVGEFVDMSVASNFGMAAIVASVLTVNHDVNVWVAALIALVISTVVGLVNGFLVVKMGVNTIVVTLGMSTLLLGLAQWMANLMPVSGLPKSFSNLALTKILGLPTSFYFGVILMLVFAYVLKFTPLGRNMRFVGENREVSRLAGVRVTRVRIGAFTVAGVIAGLGGIISASATGGFDPSTSQMYLMPMFAATFLGTAILQPGRFTPLGTLLAVYFLATGVLGLQLLGATAWVSNVFYGGVLVIAVTLTTILARRQR
ncbi:MAG: ABC transporter permease [Arthrobacter sp.]|jgi:ribose transport system permease protein|nr:ABC transporter permease [Arthrobacter sp.]